MFNNGDYQLNLRSMYEEKIAQIIIEQVKTFIIWAFAQLDGKDSDYYTKLYLTIEDGKNEIKKRSGLSQEVINRITALVGEKSAAEMGIALLDNFVKNDAISEKQISCENKKKEEGQRILKEQLLTIITHKMNREYVKNNKVTVVELKFMKIISSEILKLLLKKKGINLDTEISLEKIQNIIKNAAMELIKLINNNGRVIGKITTIPKDKANMLQKLNSTLNIMNIDLRKGTGNELIAPPDFTPSINKENVRNR
ncbi:MAG: hypothetical protein HRK26_05615 [Rickettsiaceae bacterium H1]|nr:hypothetical protein [Rickettsiaceae bacterium H1]